MRFARERIAVLRIQRAAECSESLEEKLTILGMTASVAQKANVQSAGI
jgi:hypothetical protein